MLQLKQNYSLSDKNTFRLISHASDFCIVHKREQLPEVHKHAQTLKKNIFILGSGSNVVLPDVLDALVIQSGLKGFELRADKSDDDTVYLNVGSGEEWSALIQFCLNNHYCGLENLTLIPGKVGAAPIQNIGAYGVEVEQFIESVDVFDFSDGCFKTLLHKDCLFTYRGSIFKQNPGRYFILAVNFVLKKTFHADCSYQGIQDYLRQRDISFSDITQEQLSGIISEIRTSKLPDPNIIPNVGSFFKNPFVNQVYLDAHQEQLKYVPVYLQEQGGAKLSAAWLIEQCGWKGKCFKDLKVSALHALVLENHGQATQQDVLELANQIQASVKQAFEIDLEIEPVMVT